MKRAQDDSRSGPLWVAATHVKEARNMKRAQVEMMHKIKDAVKKQLATISSGDVHERPAWGLKQFGRTQSCPNRKRRRSG
jgi:hypothetical protein